jgi:predicted permease
MLGVRSERGRPLLDSDDRFDAPLETVISHNFWTRRFANDPAIIGRKVQFNGQPFTIAGIAERGFVGGMRPHSVDAWITIRASRVLYPAERFGWISNRGSRALGLLARLRDGATFDGAQAEFDVLAERLYATHPQEWRNIRNTGRTISVVAESETRVPPDFNGPAFGFMTLLMAVVGLVLLTACANLANLLLARGTANAREIGMRLALGSGRIRIIRQLLTENLLLSVAGGAAGLAVAWALMRALTYFKPPISVPVALDLQLDGTVLTFTLGVSLLTGLAIGLAPALHAVKKDLLPVLKDNTAIGSPRRSRLSRAFVIVQVAVSVLLLIGAGLFLRSLQKVTATDAGFDPANMVVMTLSPGLQGYDEGRGRALYEKVLEHISALPQVQSASLAMGLPLGMMGPRRGVVIEGYQPQDSEDMEISWNVVGPSYFETMRIPILRGRSFGDNDRTGALPVIIVNEEFVQRYWRGTDPLGKRMSINGPSGPFREVVGVVPTGKYNTLGEEPQPFIYVPLWQEYRGAAALHVRTVGDPGAMLSSVRAAIRSIDRTVPVFDAKTMEDQLLLPLLPARVAGILLGVFSALALLLSSVGIYGLVSYSVAQQTREIGVRLALGASRQDLLFLIAGDCTRLILIGAVLGSAAAAAVTGFLAPLLYGITPYDAIAFSGGIIVLGFAALLACYLPARRAVRIDPITALRFE